MLLHIKIGILKTRVSPLSSSLYSESNPINHKGSVLVSLDENFWEYLFHMWCEVNVLDVIAVFHLYQKYSIVHLCIRGNIMTFIEHVCIFVQL